MKCPNCGAEIENGKYCTFCGTKFDPGTIRAQEIVNKSGCPKCGSTNVEFKREFIGEVQKKNQKKAVNHTMGICNDCGYTWTTDDGKTMKKRKTWLWVLGWIFIFPLPLTIILVRKKDWKPVLKYGLIVVAWLVYLLIAFAGGNGSESNPEQATGTDISQNTNVVATAENETIEPESSTEPEEDSVIEATQSTTKTTTQSTTEQITQGTTKATTQVTTQTPVPPATTTTTGTTIAQPVKHDYILNTNTKKFHYSNCSEVKKIKEEHISYLTGTREDAINAGYEPCGRCKP